MQKTLLDEFAMAAMLGWLSSRRDPAVTIDQAKAAASFYDMAEAMMAERAKRMPAPTAPAEDKKSNAAVMNDTLLEAILSMKGQKVTCGELFQKAYGQQGSLFNLREVGETLRAMGYQRKRSGGKDYYQL